MGKLASVWQRDERFLPHVPINLIQVRDLAQAAAAQAAQAAALHAASKAQGPKTPSQAQARARAQAQAQAYAHAQDQAVRVQAAHVQAARAQAWMGGRVLRGDMGIKKKRRAKAGAESAEEAAKHFQILRKLLNEPPEVSRGGVCGYIV